MPAGMTYKRHVSRDLPVWVSKGWVDAKHAEALLASIPEHNFRDKLPTIIAILGGVLLAFAAMSFVAANWTDISKLVRLGILFSALWVAYAGAAWANAKNWPIFYEAAVVLGCGLFGANIMLIAQMYHIDRHYPDGFMVWALGSLLAAGLCRSVGAVLIGFALLCLWTASETVEFWKNVHWPFLIAWGAAAWLVWQERWYAGINAAAISLFVWITVSVVTLADRYDWSTAPALSVLSLTSIIFLVVAVHFEDKRQDGDDLKIISVESLVLFFATLFLFQLATDDLARSFADVSISDRFGAGGFWLPTCLVTAALAAALAFGSNLAGGMLRKDAIVLTGAAVTILISVLVPFPAFILVILFGAGYLALSIWSINFGQRRDSPAAINIGFAAFGIETLYLYFETVGTLLNTAVFFLTGGIVLVLLAFALERMRRRLMSSHTASEMGAGS